MIPKKNKPTDDADDESRMPLWQHLDDLRKGLIRALMVVALGTCITYYFSDQLVTFLEAPLLEVLPADSPFPCFAVSGFTASGLL